MSIAVYAPPSASPLCRTNSASRAASASVSASDLLLLPTIDDLEAAAALFLSEDDLRTLLLFGDVLADMDGGEGDAGATNNNKPEAAAEDGDAVPKQRYDLRRRKRPSEPEGSVEAGASTGERSRRESAEKRRRPSEEDVKKEQPVDEADEEDEQTEPVIRVPTDPAVWTQNDIANWLGWMERKFQLKGINVQNFPTNGQHLCQLTRADFENLTGDAHSGRTMSSYLAIIRGEPTSPMSALPVHRPTSDPGSDPTDPGQKDPPPGRSASARPMEAVQRPAGPSGPASLPKAAAAEAQSTSSSQSPLAGVLHKEINEHTYKEFLPVPGSGAGQIQLWQFLLELLSDPAANSDVICWEGAVADGNFRLHDPDEVARRWGDRKAKANMNYDKLSRALRYYYDKNILSKIAGKRYAYRFDFHALTLACRAQQAPAPSDAKMSELTGFLAPLLSSSSTPPTSPSQASEASTSTVASTSASAMRRHPSGLSVGSAASPSLPLPPMAAASRMTPVTSSEERTMPPPSYPFEEEDDQDRYQLPEHVSLPDDLPPYPGHLLWPEASTSADLLSIPDFLQYNLEPADLRPPEQQHHARSSSVPADMYFETTDDHVQPGSSEDNLDDLFFP